MRGAGHADALPTKFRMELNIGQWPVSQLQTVLEVPGCFLRERTKMHKVHWSGSHNY